MTSAVSAARAGSLIKRGRVGLAILLIYVLLLGGTEVGAFSPSLRMLNALIGGIIVVWWILLLQRGVDQVDLLAMGSLLAFLVACLFSEYPRQSFDAAVSALAWAAAFGVARRHLARYRERRMFLRMLSLVGLLLSLYFVALWGPTWVAWIRLSGTAPPFDLSLPVHIFRHQYVVAMLLATLMPASAALLRDRAWRYASGLTLILSVVLILMSGSRGVWLAIALAAIVLTWRVRPSRRVVTIGLASVVGVAALAVIIGLLGPISNRILASSTVTFRFDIWTSTVAIWADRPITGAGPGTYGIELTFQTLQEGYQYGARHAHNALIQLAAEGGIVGALGAVFGIVAVWTGRGISRRGWLAIIGLTTIAGASLTDNPLDAANLVAVAIAWCAFLAPYQHVEHLDDTIANTWNPARAGTAAMAIALAAAVGVTTAGSLSHAAGISAMRGGDLGAALTALRRAAALDPAMALYRRELGVLLVADGRLASGIIELQRAATMNPADTAALRALALALSAAGEHEDARSTAQRAVDLRPLYAENHLVFALVGDRTVSEVAIKEALTISPWLPASSAWADPLPTGDDLGRLIRGAAERATDKPAARRALSIVWLRAIAGLGLPDLNRAGGEVALEALALALTCQTDDARTLLRELGGTWSGSAAGTVSRILLDREHAASDLADTIALASLQQRDLAATAARSIAPYAAGADPQEDARLYHRLSLGVSTPGPTIPRDADGTSGWLLGTHQAACVRGEG